MPCVRSGGVNSPDESEHGWRGGDALARDWWHTDIELNAQGLEVWLDRAG